MKREVGGIKLFLDDIRLPQVCTRYMGDRIGDLVDLYREDWVIVRNYDEFCRAIRDDFDTITHVSFDHDLAEAHYNPDTWTEGFVYNEKTGLDCAKFMKEYYEVEEHPLPIMFVHSMNPVGTKAIIELFKEKK